MRQVDESFRRMVEGYGLTTMKIIYHMPDHPSLLNWYLWQEYDLYPQFPKLKKFLDFWKDKIEGRIEEVVIAHQRLIRPAEFRIVGSEFRLQ